MSLNACRGAQVLAIMTPWREFAGVDVADLARVMSGRMILDPFGVLPSRKCQASEFSHFKLGTPALYQEAVA